MAYIGQADALGETFYVEVAKFAQLHKITMVANERFNRTDPSVTGQILKILAAKPDAVVVGAAGTPAALPPKTLVMRGYKGKIYHNHGTGNRDFLRVCGADCNGTFLPTSPVLVAAQLPDDHPAKRLALAYIKLYEAQHGPGSVSAFGSYAWDAGMLLNRAVPLAMKAGAPGTPEFRRALRDALEGTKRFRRYQRPRQHDAERPHRPRPARARDGRNPRWQVGLSAALTGFIEVHYPKEPP